MKCQTKSSRGISRAEFEQSARDQNARRDAEVSAARSSASPCDVVTMLAFGGLDYCRSHRSIGSCPFAKQEGGAR